MERRPRGSVRKPAAEEDGEGGLLFTKLRKLINVVVSPIAPNTCSG